MRAPAPAIIAARRSAAIHHRPGRQGETKQSRMDIPCGQVSRLSRSRMSKNTAFPRAAEAQYSNTSRGDPLARW
jgi:hypothetical protein